MARRALSAPLTLVIAAVVLIVVAMVLIGIFGGGMQPLQNTVPQEEIQACKTCVLGACSTSPNADPSDIAEGECKNLCEDKGISCSATGGNENTCKEVLLGDATLKCS